MGSNEAPLPWALGWLNLLVLSLFVLLLADNLLVLLAGWIGSSLAALGLLAPSQTSSPTASGPLTKPFLAHRAGDVLLLLAICLVFWGLGGSWSARDYTPDLEPRFRAVVMGTPASAKEREQATLPPTKGNGLLTMTDAPGALVFMDDSRTPLLDGDAPVRSPFVRRTVAGGFHTFRIHPGGALDDSLVGATGFGGEREIVLAETGPSLVLRNLKDQLTIENTKHEHPVRDAILGRRAFSRLPLALAVCILLVLAAATRVAAAIAGAPWPLALAEVTGGAYLLARAAFLFELVIPPAVLWTLVAALLAGAAVRVLFAGRGRGTRPA